MEIVQGLFSSSEIKKKLCYSFPAEQAVIILYPLNIREFQVLIRGMD